MMTVSAGDVKARGATRTEENTFRSNVSANSSPVTAPSTPIDVPDGRRPVSLAAPRMVVVSG